MAFFDVAKVALFDVAKVALFDVAKVALFDVAKVALFDVAKVALFDVAKVALFDVAKVALFDVAKVALFDVAKVALFDVDIFTSIQDVKSRHPVLCSWPYFYFQLKFKMNVLIWIEKSSVRSVMFMIIFREEVRRNITFVRKLFEDRPIISATDFKVLWEIEHEIPALWLTQMIDVRNYHSLVKMRITDNLMCKS